MSSVINLGKLVGIIVTVSRWHLVVHDFLFHTCAVMHV